MFDASDVKCPGTSNKEKYMTMSRRRRMEDEQNLYFRKMVW